MEPMYIFKSDEILSFWPSATQSARERVSATTRFILYASLLTYLINRDPRVFVFGAISLAILYYLQNTNFITDGKRRPPITDSRQPNMHRQSVTMPTFENSMGNVLMTDYVDYPDRPAAAWHPSVQSEVQHEWSKIHPLERTRDAERNFYTMPSTTIPNDQTGFAYAAYGTPFEPKCRDQGGEACDPDGVYSGFPERTQMTGGN